MSDDLDPVDDRGDQAMVADNGNLTAGGGEVEQLILELRYRPLSEIEAPRAIIISLADEIEGYRQRFIEEFALDSITSGALTDERLERLLGWVDRQRTKTGHRPLLDDLTGNGRLYRAMRDLLKSGRLESGLKYFPVSAAKNETRPSRRRNSARPNAQPSKSRQSRS